MTGKQERLQICHSEERSDEESSPARRRIHRTILRRRRAQYPDMLTSSCLCRPRSGGVRIPRNAVHFCHVWGVGLPAVRFCRPPWKQPPPPPIQFNNRPRSLGSGISRRRFGYFAAVGKVPRPQAKSPHSNLSGNRGRPIWRPYGAFCQSAGKPKHLAIIDTTISLGCVLASVFPHSSPKVCKKRGCPKDSLF